MFRRLPCLVFAPLVLSGCFDPAELDLDTDTLTTGAGTDNGTDSLTTEPSTTSATDPSTTGPTDPSTTASGTGAVCGDGAVNGDEVCDDGVNDGSYGSCLDDCSAPAAFCGDEEVNGDEACDDAVNDGAYDGCNADCTLGPRCGDGEINGDEGCDDGDENANGAGCNVDCVVSGSELGRHNTDNLDFCESSSAPDPAINSMGNAYAVNSGGGCGNDDSLLLVEVDPAGNEVVAYLDTLIVADEQISSVTARPNDDWLLAAGICNYILTPTGELTELCDQGRITGHGNLESRTDGSYLAHSFQNIAFYPATSPAAADSPIDSEGAPLGNYIWELSVGRLGHAGSVIRAGSRTTAGNPPIAYIQILSGALNQVSSRTHSDRERFDDVHPSPDGGYVAWSQATAAGGPIIRKLNADLTEAWSRPSTGTPFTTNIDVDSENNIVIVWGDQADVWTLEKWTPDGLTLMWDQEITEWTGDGGGSNAGLTIAPDDSIWITHQFRNITQQFEVIHLAP